MRHKLNHIESLVLSNSCMVVRLDRKQDIISFSLGFLLQFGPIACPHTVVGVHAVRHPAIWPYHPGLLLLSMPSIPRSNGNKLFHTSTTFKMDRAGVLISVGCVYDCGSKSQPNTGHPHHRLTWTGRTGCIYSTHGT